MNEAIGRAGGDDPAYSHLHRLMGPHGLFEHARYLEPRLNHGYAVDDNARALVVTGGVDHPRAGEIFDRCLLMVSSGLGPHGWHNRMSAEGRWTDDLGSEDAHGRALWGLGSAAALGLLTETGVSAFRAGTLRSLTPLRSTVYALLGVADALGHPDTASAARTHLERNASSLPPSRSGAWPWPEDRLTYDNARIPQAMMAVGSALGNPTLTTHGLELLEWLVRVESRGHHFSFTPVGGRGPGETGPAFDQQPLEAWAMADACLVAARLTGESHWLEYVRRAGEWFSGRNDAGVILYDPSDGSGFDGLEPHGANQNRGAESTLAALGTRRTVLRAAQESPSPGQGGPRSGDDHETVA